MSYQFFVYHSNDLHSHFEQWPKIVAYFNGVKKDHEHKGEESFFFDIGDHIDRFNPITEATLGQANTVLMNEVSYHDVTIGNNEGITLAKNDLEQLYEKATFNVLASNLFHLNGEQPSWIKPYSIYTIKNGCKVGVIGLTVSFKAFYEKLGWKVEDPFLILPKLLEEVQKQVDVVIVLSHLGINQDRRMAAEFNGIHLILGGHTHHLLDEGEWVNNTLLCAAGKFGRFVGKVTITMDEKTMKPQKLKAITIPLADYEENKDSKERLLTLQKESNVQLNEVVSTLKEPLPIHWFRVTALSQLLADALREWCKADIGMLNAGVLLEGLPNGPVTKGDIHRICPHPINPCKLQLKGKDLWKVIDRASSEEMRNLKLLGLGFRGKIMGEMIYSGLEVPVSPYEGRSIECIRFEGRELQLEGTYSIATLDMFTLGNLYPEFRQAEQIHYYLPEFLRDLLEWKLTNVYF